MLNRSSHRATRRGRNRDYPGSYINIEDQLWYAPLSVLSGGRGGELVNHVIWDEREVTDRLGLQDKGVLPLVLQGLVCVKSSGRV